VAEGSSASQDEVLGVEKSAEMLWIQPCPTGAGGKLGVPVVPPSAGEDLSHGSGHFSPNLPNPAHVNNASCLRS
jgi:hypothetical protein